MSSRHSTYVTPQLLLLLEKTQNIANTEDILNKLTGENNSNKGDTSDNSKDNNINQEVGESEKATASTEEPVSDASAEANNGDDTPKARESEGTKPKSNQKKPKAPKPKTPGGSAHGKKQHDKRRAREEAQKSNKVRLGPVTQHNNAGGNQPQRGNPTNRPNGNQPQRGNPTNRPNGNQPQRKNPGNNPAPNKPKKKK